MLWPRRAKPTALISKHGSEWNLTLPGGCLRVMSEWVGGRLLPSACARRSMSVTARLKESDFASRITSGGGWTGTLTTYKESASSVVALHGVIFISHSTSGGRWTGRNSSRDLLFGRQLAWNPILDSQDGRFSTQTHTHRLSLDIR